MFTIASDGTSFFGAFQGSSGTVQVSNWQASVPSSTTTTTTTTATVSVTEETSSSSTSSTGFGGLASYTPQVVPTIYISSVGLAGQHNIYWTHNGSVTLTGFLTFSIGASVGEFGCLTLDSSGACIKIPAPSPSSGTFQSFNWQLPPTVEPQPTCSIIPYLWFCKSTASPLNLVETSQTRYGIVCNNENIVNSVAECSSHGRPVKYQTFSVTVSDLSPGLNVVTLLATGSESNGEAFTSNVFVYNG